MGRRQSGNGGGGGALRAKTINATVPRVAGLLTTVSRFGLLTPVTYAKSAGGSANLSINTSTGGISAAVALEAGATQALNGTATGADGVVLPFTVNLTGQVSVPAAPTVTLTPGNGQISIAWVDGDNGGASITAHRIYVNGTPMLPTNAASPYVLTGLANGVAVDVQVSALNSAGEGAKSPSQSVTPVFGLNTTPPSIAGVLTNGSTLTCTPGIWTGGTPTRQWYRDGVAISGATGLTYTYVAATDDGCYLTVVETVGAVTATSNALIAGPNLNIYTTSFAGPDGTDLNGFEGWVSSATGRFKILNNDILIYTAPGTAVSRALVGGQTDMEVSMTLAFTAGAGPADVGNFRYIYARWTDANNNIEARIQGNGYTVSRRVAGVATQIGNGVFSPNLVTGDAISLRVKGNYARFYKNGVEVSDSITANGGLGYDVTGVPLIAKVGMNTGGGTAATPFPMRFATDFSVKAVADNTVSINSTSISTSASLTNQPRVTAVGSITGAVTQLQMLVVSPTGKVLLPWADVGAPTGSAFTVTSVDLPAEAQGLTVSVWVRDKINKSAISSMATTVGYYATIFPTVIGLNEGYWTYWNPANPTVDLGPRGEFYSPSLGDVLPMANKDAATNRPISYYGSDTYVEWAFLANTLGPLSPGNYVVTYPATMTATAGTLYNCNVSTAFSGGAGVVTVTGNGPIIRVRLSGTIPSGGAWISCKKQGETSTKRYTAQIANDYAEAGFKIARFMTPFNINGNPGYSLTGSTILQPGDIRACTVEYMTEFCNENGVDLWFNVHHLADDSYITAAANYLAGNLSAPRKVWIELSNEMWNSGFASHDYSRMTGSALGFYNTNGDATPSNIITGQFNPNTGATTIAYSAGTRIFGNLYGTGWQVWQAVGDQPAGSVIAANSNANWVVVANNIETALAGRRWQAKRSKEIFAIFDAAFGSAARLRTVRVLGAWALDTTTTLSHRLLWGNLYQSLDRIATAPYWGTSLGDYSGSHRTGWGATEKALYSTNVDAWKNAFFSVVNADIDATIATASTLKQSVEDMLRRAPYNLPANTIKMCSYECGWHVTMGNYPDLTLAGTAFNSLRADPRCATAMTYYLNQIKAKLGGEHVIFDSVARPISPGTGYIFAWGIMYGQGDRTEPRYNAVKAWIAANG